MKNFILTSFFSVLLLSYSTAQISIYWDEDPGNTYNSSTINILKDVGSFDVYMHCENTGTTNQEIKFRRIVLNSSITFSDQFCDNNLCYPCFGNDWTSPASTMLMPADSSVMKPTISFLNGAGTAEIRYYVLDINDQPIDSVDVNITCTVGMEDTYKKITRIYPNPSAVTLNVENVFGSKLELNMLNKYGESVDFKIIPNGKSTFDVSHLSSGNYFINIISNGELMETKKIIVLH